MVTPRSATSVKSDSPIRPGGCSWRKITSRSSPFTARHARMLQRPPCPGAQVGMPAAEFLEDGDRPQAGRIFQQRDDFTVPDLGQGIGAAAFPTRLLLAGKSGVFFKAIGGGRAEAGLRAGNRRRMLATRVHE